MNKKIYLLLIIPIIIFIQIINIIRDAKYNWDIIISEILLIFIVLIIFVLFNIGKYKKIVQHFNNKDYVYVINTKRLIFPKKSIQLHYFYYMKAVSCMETNDFSNFKIYIDKIKNESLLMTKNLFESFICLYY